MSEDKPTARERLAAPVQLPLWVLLAMFSGGGVLGLADIATGPDMSRFAQKSEVATKADLAALEKRVTAGEFRQETTAHRTDDLEVAVEKFEARSETFSRNLLIICRALEVNCER